MPVWARGERLWNCSGADGASSRSMCQPVRWRSRGRGVRDVRLLAFEEVDELLGRFDTIVMFGNNFGFGRRARPCACSGGSARWRTGSWQARMTLTRRRTQPISPIRSATASGPNAGPATAAYSLPRPHRALVRLPDCLARRNGDHRRRRTMADRTLLEESGSGYYVAVLE